MRYTKIGWRLHIPALFCHLPLNLFDNMGMAVGACRALGECDVILEKSEALLATAAWGRRRTIVTDVTSAAAATFTNPGG